MLALVGFSKTRSHSDNVRYAACDVNVQQWQPEDDPAAECKIWAPRRLFVDALERYERKTTVVPVSILLGLFRTDEYANVVFNCTNQDDNLYHAITVLRRHFWRRL